MFKLSFEDPYYGDTELKAAKFADLCAEIAEHAHPQNGLQPCDIAGCDTANMMHHGFHRAAVASIASATESVVVGELYEKYPRLLTRKVTDKESDQWWAYVGPWSAKCPECWGMVYGDPEGRELHSGKCPYCGIEFDADARISEYADAVASEALDTMLWATTADIPEDADVSEVIRAVHGKSLSDLFDADDVPAAKREELREQCEDFVRSVWEMVREHEPRDLGHAFALTAGGWDAGFVGRFGKDSDRLGDAARTFTLPELYLYVAIGGLPAVDMCG
ncbi:transposase family protein [Streptomyces variabilis]